MENTNLKPVIRFPEFTENWKPNVLGKLENINFLKGKGISKADIIDDGKTECIRYGELYTIYDEVINKVYSKTNLPTSELVLSKANDVIIPASGETQIDIATASCVLRDDIALSGDLNIIRSEINGVFLSYYLNNKKKKAIARLAQGSSVIHLYNPHLKTLKLNLPIPAEQKKIADFLTSVETGINSLKEKKDTLEAYKKGVMQKIFKQEIRFKDDNGNDFPDWEEKKIIDVANIIGGGTPSTFTEEYWNGEINWFTPTEIKSRYSYESERKISETGLKNSSATILPINSILFTSRATIGAVSITKEICSTNQGFQSFIPKENSDIDFLYYWIQYNSNKFIRVATGTTFIEVSKKEVEKIDILKPHKKEQFKIGQYLKKIDDKVDALQQKIDFSVDFKKGLLQKMFV